MRFLVLALLALLAVSGCAVAVPGRAVPEPALRGATPVSAPGNPASGNPAPGSAASGSPASGSAASGGAAPTLVADVLPDECLLDAEGFARLLGQPVEPPANGGTPSSCATAATRGSPRALAAINVYGVRGGSPRALLRAGQELPGVGDGAAVVGTVLGPTLQVAAGAYLVTIAVADGEPTEARWAEAGRAVVARLP